MFKRLMQNDETYHLFPEFRDRVINFAKEFDLECPIDSIVYEMTQRWFMTPNLAGYFAGIQEGKMYAHWASWITSGYGQNKLYVYQAQADNYYANFDLFWQMVQEWIRELNKGLPETQQVKKFEFCTWHSEDVYVRYFKQRGVKALGLRHVIGGDILN